LFGRRKYRIRAIHFGATCEGFSKHLHSLHWRGKPGDGCSALRNVTFYLAAAGVQAYRCPRDGAIVGVTMDAQGVLTEDQSFSLNAFLAVDGQAENLIAINTQNQYVQVNLSYPVLKGSEIFLMMTNGGLAQVFFDDFPLQG